MKNILKIFTILLITVSVYSCNESLKEKKAYSKGLMLESFDQASYGFMFRKSIVGPSYLQTAGNGFQLLHSLYFDLYANYFATSTPNFLSDRFVLVGSWLNGAFNSFYASESHNIKYSEDFARIKGLHAEKAIMKIWKVYIYSRYTDALGPIPYSQYGNLRKEVHYDTQEFVYNSFFSELDSAITILKTNVEGTSVIAQYDPIYSGNLEKWQKFGSSLRLRLAMRVKYADAALAVSSNLQCTINGK